MALYVKLSLRLMGLIVFGWWLVFYYHEVYVPNSTVKMCSWMDYHVDDADHRHSTPGLFTKVMLVADPQLIDGHTYPGRNDFLLKVSQHTVDMYLHRNYKALLKQLKPDYIFFLGDLLDSARSSLDEYFETQVDRFKRIFDIDPRYRFDKNVFLNVAGNHDIGFGNQLVQSARTRFESVFGRPNTFVDINGVDFVTVDGPLLSSADPHVKDDTLLFLSSYKNNPNKSSARVLLTHVPLHRDPTTKPCKNPREYQAFSLTKGHQYQLALDQLVSEEIIQAVHPFVIFSGDDHDYCVVEHVINDYDLKRQFSAIEYTVKSISMAMGIRFPAVQLLTFATIVDVGFTYTSNQCFLEQPYYNIVAYVTLAVISGVLLLVVNLVKRRIPTPFVASVGDEESKTNLRALRTGKLLGYKLLCFLRDAFIVGVIVMAVYAVGFCWW